MAFDGTLKFDTAIVTKGFDKGISSLNKKLDSLKNAFETIKDAVASIFDLGNILEFAKSAEEAFHVQFEAETRLEQVLKNTTGASQEQIQSIKDYASELQNIGIIGDEITLSGLQELGTYIENSDSLKTMAGVLDDMLVQQYGLNATTESAVTISTMLGKVLEGQTSALSRYGYSFDEAQEQLLKYGTEEQRVATLAEVVSESVGGMNQAFAQTYTGQLKQVENNLGDIQEAAGEIVTNIKSIFLPVLNTAVSMLAEMVNKVKEVSTALADAFGIPMTEADLMADGVELAVENEEALTEAVENTAKELQNSLAGFDQMNILTSQSPEITMPETEADSVTAEVEPEMNLSEAEKKVDELTGRLSRIIEPIKLAWEDNSPQLIANARYAAESIKGLLSSVAESFEAVWTNGTGERSVGNIIVLFSDVLAVIGDISAALENAWNDGGRGESLVQSYLDRWNSLLELIHSVTDSFRTAWNSGQGESILGNILEIITNINNYWANLRTNFTQTWNENDRGVKLWESILSIIDSVLSTINNITEASAEWAAELDLAPMLDSINGLLEKIQPLSNNIGEGLEWFYTEVLLPLGSWTLEKAVPTFLDLLSSGLEVLNEAVEALKPLGKWLWEKFLKKLASFTGGMIVSVLETLKKVLDGIAEWIRNNQDKVQDLAIVIGSFAGVFALVSGAVSIYNGVAAIAATVSTALGSAITFLGSPIGIIVVLIGMVVYAGIMLIRHWDEVKEKVGPIWEAVKNSVGSFINSVVEMFTNIVEFFKGIWESIKETFSAVGEWFTGIFTGARDSIQAVWSAVSEWFGNVWENIKNAFSSVGSWFKDIFTKARDSVKNVWSAVAEWFGNIWKKIKDFFAPVTNWFRDKFSGAWEAIQAVWNAVTGYFQLIWEGIKTVFSVVKDVLTGNFSGAWEGIKNIFSNVKGFFSDRWNDIKGVFSDVGDWFFDKFKYAYDKVTGVWEKIKDFFSGIWQGLSDGAREGINWVIEKIDGILWRIEDGINGIIDGLNSMLSFHIPDAVPIVGGLDFSLGLPHVSIPQIPYLAQGTAIPASYGEFLAVLGDNKRETEVVSPVSEIEKAVRKGMQGISSSPQQAVINLYLYPNSSAFRREIISLVNEDKARRGK